MKKIHITAQGKGGSGKTTIAAFMTQYLISRKEIHPLCIDLDPVNRSFSSYKSFDAKKISILDGDA